MKRRFVSSLLAAAMAATLLAGCGGDGGSKDGGDAPANGGGDAQTEQGGGDISTDIDMEEEPYTVAIQVVTLPGTQIEGEAELEEAINAITVPEINCKIDLQFVWIDEIVNTTSMAVAGGEKIDLVHVATVNSLSSLVGSDILYDMNTDNLLQNRGAKLVELMGDLMETGNVDGKQLAVPAQSMNANANGFAYNKTLTDKYNITVPEKGTMDDLEKLLYDFKEATAGTEDEKVMPFYVGQGQLNYLYWLVGYEGFGSECSYGAILDGGTTIENIYASEMFEEFCLRAYKWRQDGLIGGDPTDTNTAQSYANSGQLLTMVASINEKQRATYGAQNPDELGWCVLVEPRINTAAVTEYMWGIASNSERPDKAMDMLNLIYSNTEVANLIKYGREGINYEKVSDKVIQVNGSYITLFYCGGNDREIYVESPAGDDYVEKREAMEAEATTSQILGYMFDDSQFQTESSVIYSTILEYLPTLQNGMCESEDATKAYVEEFVQKLEANGINDVIAANQQQLNAWLGQ